MTQDNEATTQPIREVPGEPGTLAIETGIFLASPLELFEQWTNPRLLKAWWPQEAEVDARLGGEYHLSWPQMGWDLRGEYTRCEPGQELAFTWRWDHEPETRTRHVSVTFHSEEDVITRLRLVHGTYDGSPEALAERQGHLDGWVYFLTRLYDLVNRRVSIRISREEA